MLWNIGRLWQLGYSILLGFLFCTMSIAVAGDRIGNGSGPSEQTVINAWLHLERFVNYCLADNFCDLAQSEKETLLKIKDVIGQENSIPVEQLLIFTTADKMKDPKFFHIDGQAKMAKTGGRIGSPIFFNLDLLNSRPSPKIIRPISMSDAIALLVHEVGHHTGELDHTMLGALGAKVASAASKNTEEATLFLNSDDLKIVVMNPSGNIGYPLVLAQVLGKTVNLTEQVKEELKCSADWDSLFIKKRPMGAKFFNLYWPIKDLHLKEKSDLKFVLKGNLALYCGDDESDWKYQKNHQLKIKLRLKYHKEGDVKFWALEEDEIKVRQRLIPWWFFFKIPSLTRL